MIFFVESNKSCGSLKVNREFVWEWNVGLESNNWLLWNRLLIGQKSKFNTERVVICCIPEKCQQRRVHCLEVDRNGALMSRRFHGYFISSHYCGRGSSSRRWLSLVDQECIGARHAENPTHLPEYQHAAIRSTCEMAGTLNGENVTFLTHAIVHSLSQHKNTDNYETTGNVEFQIFYRNFYETKIR